jgi:hypothetical protein
MVLIISSCGIAVPYYFNPPTKKENLSFTHPYNNDPNFAVGYEIFYHIYDGTSITENTVINNANNFFTTDSNLLELLSSNQYINSNFYFKRILPISDSISTDYKLINNPISTVGTPLFRVDPLYFDTTDSSKQFSVSIFISPIGIGTITTFDYTPGSSYLTSMDFSRYVSTNDNDFYLKNFLEIDETQDDVPLLDGSPTINIAFFVVLYGRTEQFSPIFSDVIYIGSVTNFVFNS